MRDSPTGAVRINAHGPSADYVLCPLVFDFMRLHSEMQLQIAKEAALVDIVRQGFDAGVRFGQQV